jgi:hypothetical protein
MATAGTVSIVKLIVIFLTLFVSSILQFIAFSETSKSDDVFVKSAHKHLLRAAIMNLVFVIVTILIFVYIFYKKSTLLATTPILINVMLLLLTVSLFVSGVYSSLAASDLRCVKDTTQNTKSIHNAHLYSSICAVMGIVGVVLVLLVQAYLRVSTPAYTLPQSKKLMNPDTLMNPAMLELAATML